MKRITYIIGLLLVLLLPQLTRAQTQTWQAQPGYVAAIQAQLNNLQQQINGFLLPTNATAGQFVVENAAGTAYVAATITGDVSASVSIPGKLTLNPLNLITGAGTNPTITGFADINGVFYPYGDIFFKSYSSGVGVQNSTTFTDTTKSPFVSTDCHSGAGCTGATDKTIVIYNALQGTNWTTGMSCPRGMLIQPLTNNAGGFIYQAQNLTNGTAGAPNPTFNQTALTVTTDGTCKWVNISAGLAGSTGEPLVTTITGYTSASAVKLATNVTAAACSGGGCTGMIYKYGNLATSAIQAAVNAASANQNGAIGAAGRVQMQCDKGGMFIDNTINLTSQGVNITGCGWGPTTGGTNGVTGNGVIQWVGAQGSPMFNVTQTWGPVMNNIRLVGLQGHEPDGIQFNGSASNNQQLVVNDVQIDAGGDWSEPSPYGGLRSGIVFSGGANDNHVLLNTIEVDQFENYCTDIGNVNSADSMANTLKCVGSLPSTGVTPDGTWGELGAINMGGDFTFVALLTLSVNGPMFNIPAGAPHAQILALKPSADATSQLLLCNNTGASGGAYNKFHWVEGTFYTGAFTISGNTIVDCGGATGAPKNYGTFDGLQMLQHSAADPIFNIAASNGQQQFWQFKDSVNQSSALTNFNENNFVTTVSGNGIINISNCSLTPFDNWCGQQTLLAGDTLDFRYLQSPGSITAAGQVYSKKLTTPTIQSCTTGTAGAATCKYKVASITNNGTQGLPTNSISCTSDTSPGTGDILKFQAPIVGPSKYEIYEDDCAGGSFLGEEIVPAGNLRSCSAGFLCWTNSGNARSGSPLTGTDLTGMVKADGFLQGAWSTFANAPTCNATLKGALWTFIGDVTTCTNGSAVTGGGSASCHAFCDGANWLAG